MYIQAKTLSVLALAGSAAALPWGGGGWGGNWGGQGGPESTSDCTITGGLGQPTGSPEYHTGAHSAPSAATGAPNTYTATVVRTEVQKTYTATGAPTGMPTGTYQHHSNPETYGTVGTTNTEPDARTGVSTSAYSVHSFTSQTGGGYQTVTQPSNTDAGATGTPSTYQPATVPSTTASAPSATGTGSGESGGTGDYMATVSKWRKAMGKGALTCDTTLEANALKTCQDGNGEMLHELNPGSMAQVLAPGAEADFEKVFVGGWLCEEPTLTGLNGICTSMDAGWDHSDGETGHADILSSDSYTKIGCGLANGIWGCDLA